jgi:hypothetical protein
VIHSQVFSQDILVLRNSGDKIKCEIVEVNDTTIQYKEWHASVDSVLVINRFDVESFTVEKKSAVNKNKKKENSRDGILGKYRAGEMRPGYIITLNGDTVNGTIKIHDIAFNQLIVNWVDEAGKANKYRPDEIIGYGYDFLNYVAVKIDYQKEITAGINSSGVLFLEEIDNGAAKLYQFVKLTYPKAVMMEYKEPPVYYGSLSIDYYVVPPKGKPRIVHGNNVRNNLIRLFEDYEDLVEEMINDRPFSEDVPSIVGKYNYWYESVHNTTN